VTVADKASFYAASRFGAACNVRHARFEGLLALIADDLRLGREGGQPAKLMAALHDADGGDRTIQPPCGGGTGQALATECDDIGLLLIGQPVGTAVGTRRAVQQTSLTFGGVAVAPLADGLGRNALCLGHGGDGPAAGRNVAPSAFDCAALYQRPYALTVFAQSRWVIDRMRSGNAMSAFQPSQQASRIAS
jgi:hypothetical protein